MMNTTNSNTKSDAGSTQNKLQRPLVGNQAKDGLSTTGRNQSDEVTRDQNQNQTETDQNKSGKRNRESMGNTAPEPKRANTAREFGRDNWPRFLVVGAKSFHSLKGGARKVLPCLEGGGAQKVSDPRFTHFVAPPSP